MGQIESERLTTNCIHKEMNMSILNKAKKCSYCWNECHNSRHCIGNNMCTIVTFFSSLNSKNVLHNLTCITILFTH